MSWNICKWLAPPKKLRTPAVLWQPGNRTAHSKYRTKMRARLHTITWHTIQSIIDSVPRYSSSSIPLRRPRLCKLVTAVDFHLLQQSSRQSRSTPRFALLSSSHAWQVVQLFARIPAKVVVSVDGLWVPVRRLQGYQGVPTSPWSRRTSDFFFQYEFKKNTVKQRRRRSSAAQSGLECTLCKFLIANLPFHRRSDKVSKTRNESGSSFRAGVGGRIQRNTNWQTRINFRCRQTFRASTTGESH